MNMNINININENKADTAEKDYTKEIFYANNTSFSMSGTDSEEKGEGFDDNKGGTISFTVGKESDGQLLKVFLRKSCGVSSRTFTKLKKISMGITRNQTLIKADQPVFCGDVITLKAIDSCKENNILPVKGKLDIVYEDEYIVLINKSPSMPVHPTKIHQENTLANFLRYVSMEKGEDFTFRAVNRLDKDTSGLVLVAKDRHSAGVLQKQDIFKSYLAICHGIVPKNGTINKPIKKAEDSMMLRIISENGDRAVTHFERIGDDGVSSLVRLWLETGRTHQIRCHMSSIGYPLEGDDLYGGGLERIKRQALHCEKMEFFHPISGKKLRFCCPAPADMEKIISLMNLYEINIE